MEAENSSISLLHEGCIADILSFIDPKEVCRLSMVSSNFNNAALSDTVWKRFLPPDCHSIISHSSSSFLLHTMPSKKQLYLSLCDNPILIKDAKMSFSLEKSSGKKCYMISARDLKITWGDTPDYWIWNSDENSRFGESAELVRVCWLEIRGKINTCMLSTTTVYSIYLVFKLRHGAYGWEDRPIQAAVGLVDSINENREQSFYLDRKNGRERGDGWLEIELGEFFNKNGEDDGDVEMSFLEVEGGNWKHGLIVQGIEIRPKPDM